MRRSFDRLVFEPKGQIRPDDYNLWRGFAIEARPGYQKQRRLLRHIWRIICRRDKAKFGYLMRWLAWAVQNPHRSPETIVVLLSSREGSGKSTLGEVMLDIFGRGKGRHGLLVDDKEQLLGRFNAHLETTSFVLAEEIMWAGDFKTADAIKSRITASVIPIEEKFGLRRQVPNHLHTMITTNHEWAVSAGEGARRYFVVEVSDEKAQDPTWFDPLRRDLGEGGLAEFLHLLLNLQLGLLAPARCAQDGGACASATHERWVHRAVAPRLRRGGRNRWRARDAHARPAGARVEPCVVSRVLRIHASVGRRPCR